MATIKEIDNVATDTDALTLQRYIITKTHDIQLTLLMTSIQVRHRGQGPDT
jgi:hypothetical protein